MPKENRGGKREGAGRKKGPARKSMTVDIKVEALARINAHVDRKGTSQAQEVEKWAMRLKRNE
jgi:hypothetical protein